ncbi:hypothetical protein BsWGS_10014 [Bradybaena similaris]
MVAMDETRKESKCNNDPWTPLPEVEPATPQPGIAPAPENPLSKMIDSERYIQTLERKLAQLSKSREGEPSSRDIITSLALFHDDQMRRYISQTDIIDFGLASYSRSDEAMPPSSFVQRKLHPEKQPLNAEEIAELVKEDVLAKVFEETVSSAAVETVQTSLSQQSQSSHLCVPSDSPADLNCAPSNSPADLNCAPSDSPADLNCASTVDGAHKLNDQEVDPNASAESVDEDWANFDDFVR